MASYSGRDSESDLDMDCSNHDSDSDSHIMAAIKSRPTSSGASRRHPLGDITGKRTLNVPTSTPKTPRTPGIRTTQAATGSGSLGTSRSASSTHDDSMDSQRYELARPSSWRQEIIERLKRVEQKQERILSLLQAKQRDQETRPPTKSKVNVPNNIRVAVKDGYSNGLQEGKQWLTEKPAGDGKTMFLRFDSAENVEMTTSIKTTVRGLYPAVNDIVLKEAIKRYFTSMKEKTRRVTTGKTRQFNEKMVLYQRKKRKLDNRKAALKSKQSWNDEKKKKMEQILKIEYMSSEEERESDGEPYFAVKKVPWRSEELEEVLRDLDKKGQSLKSAKGRKQECKRVRLEVNGATQRPKSPTEDVMWALK